jgi:hypothetical protein
VTSIVKRTWECLTPWPSGAERRDALAQAARARDHAARVARQMDERTDQVRKVRHNNGFREAFELSLHRKPHPQG